MNTEIGRSLSLVHPTPTCAQMHTHHFSLLHQEIEAWWSGRSGSLGQEDSLEKAMATHSSTLAWKIPWTEELGAGYCPWDRKESGTTERLHFHMFKSSLTFPKQSNKEKLVML